MARVLIVGCGDLGSRVGTELHHAGHQVFGMRRTIRELPTAIQGLQGDLTLPASEWPELPPRLDIVLYTAAATERTEAAYEQAYVTGIRNLLDALEQQHQSPRRLLFSSSTSVYHQHQGEWVDESSPANPTGFAGQYLLQGEQLLRSRRFPATSVRLSGLYGPGRYWLIRQALSGQPCCDIPPQYTNRIHRDDAARALAHLVELELTPASEPLADCYIASDPHPAPLHEVLHWLRQQIGAAEPDPDAPMQPRRGSKRCSSRLLQASGFRFRYPDYRAGYADIVEQFRGG